MNKPNEHFLLYQGQREGVFSVNSRYETGKKYRVQQNIPFGVLKEDLWIASLPGYKLLSLINFVPTTIRASHPPQYETYLTRWEASFLEGLAGSLHSPAARVVEIGTGRGISLAHLLIGLSHHPDVKVWSVDLEECDKALEYVQKCQIPNWRYELVVGDSVTIGLRWQGELDMVYLDGSHSHEGVLADAAIWGQCIKPSGILAFHDYGNRKHKVTAAVNEFTKGKQWKKIGRVGYLIAFERMDID